MRRLSAARAHAYDALQREYAQDNRKSDEHEQRWPGLVGEGGVFAWWCGDCVELGPKIERPTDAQKAEMVADFQRHQQTPEHVELVEREAARWTKGVPRE
jgi:hypothetical protein